MTQPETQVTGWKLIGIWFGLSAVGWFLVICLIWGIIGMFRWLF